MTMILFLLTNTQNCLSMYLFCKLEIIKNYQNVLVKKSKDQCIGNHIKQKVRLEIQKMSLHIFSKQTL